MNIVQIEWRRVGSVKAQATSKQAILAECRKMVMEQGLSAVNMRAVAQACGVALGSLYNYFPSKTDLMLATVDSVFTDIFKDFGTPAKESGFADAVKSVYLHLIKGRDTYPGFLTLHAAGFTQGERVKGRQTMEAYFAKVKQALLKALALDTAVRKDAFSLEFTREKLVDLLLSGLVMMVMQGREGIDVLLEMVRRSLY